MDKKPYRTLFLAHGIKCNRKSVSSFEQRLEELGEVLDLAHLSPVAEGGFEGDE